MTRRARRQPVILIASPPPTHSGRPPEPDFLADLDKDTGPLSWWIQVEERMRREEHDVVIMDA